MESFHIVAFTRPQEGHEGGFVLTFNATVSLGFAKNNSCVKFILKSVHALFVFYTLNISCPEYYVLYKDSTFTELLIQGQQICEGFICVPVNPHRSRAGMLVLKSALM